MQKYFGTFLIVLIPFLVGCSLEASITASVTHAQNLSGRGVQTFASSSNQFEYTPQSYYLVQSSSGWWTDQIVQKTDAGHKVYLSNQGAILPDIR